MISWRNRNSELERKEKTMLASTTPDAELVRAARRGDKRAFVEIVARHQAMVCGIALGILGDFAASEDAAQEAFLTAWRKFHDLRDPEKLRSWLGQISRNAALGHLRRRRGHGALEEALTLPDESPRPDEIAASEEEAALVRDSLAKLPENYRLPLILFYREGQSVRNVSESLNISEDAVKQRLARGREMLREQMSGLVESVLTRTAPTAVFTMTIAVAIGALATPAAIAAAAFGASSAAASTASTSLSSQIITAMSTTKTCVITAAVVAAVCIPVGYHVATNKQSRENLSAAQMESPGAKSDSKARPAFENSAIFAEWRKLHELHGTSAESMPVLYDAIAAIKDQFKRRAFRTALIAEWVQVDPQGGFAFLFNQRDTSQRQLFFQEWLARDGKTAVDALLASGPGWEQMARGALNEIARKAPARIPEIIERLPKPSNNYWDTTVRDAFAIVAEGNLESARKSAEAITGANREQALAGVAQTWAKNNLAAALAWVNTLPEATKNDGIVRDEIIRAALFGKASVDPASALDQIGMVPPGGKQGYFATTTGARVLKEAVKADYDATVAWIAAHPGKVGREDLLGMANAVSERLNADPIAFLNRHAADNTLLAIMPALNSSLLNEGGGQRAKIWEWLKTQPENNATRELRRQVIHAAGYQDPALALRIAGELPATPENDAEIQSLAGSFFNGGQMLNRLDKLLEQAPERLRQPILENAFTLLRDDTLTDPQTWIARLSLLPEASRGRALYTFAQAWGAQAPEEALGWVTALPVGQTRADAMSAVAAAWAQKDLQGAANWLSTISDAPEHDRLAAALVPAIVEKNPREAAAWVLAIKDEQARNLAASHALTTMAFRNPAAAQQWIESSPFTPELKAQLQAALGGRENLTPKASVQP
jgi:RNA polymerase sigma factor (sigma-70 family)